MVNAELIVFNVTDSVEFVISCKLALNKAEPIC